MRLEELNVLPDDVAVAEFRQCCGSTRWADAMDRAMPFPSIGQMAEKADEIWRSLDPADWLEAFAAHPRIGERSSAHSLAEQRRALSASDAVRDTLTRYNRDYEIRFGHIFIVCATGKSAEEMLAILVDRMTNVPEDELRIAAEEQRKITGLRLRMRFQISD